MKLKDQVAVITGGSMGIGEAIAKVFVEEGAKVVCAARTFSEGDHPFLEGTLKRTVELIRAKGGEAKPVTANVSVEDDCIALVDAARDYGPVDILVNNAALTYYQPITEMQTNRWFRAFAVDVHGPFMLAKEVLKDMIPRRSGAIINISSGAAIGPGRGPYADKSVRGGTEFFFLRGFRRRADQASRDVPARGETERLRGEEIDGAQCEERRLCRCLRMHQCQTETGSECDQKERHRGRDKRAGECRAP